MHIAELVKSYYDDAQDDPTILPALIQAKKLALSGLMEKGGGNTLTNSQKNAISFSVLASLPEPTRITLLTKAISFIKQGIRPSTRTRGGF